MMKYLRHMMVFNAVVDAGSISAAATQLALSKSVVSQQLHALEQALQVQLLSRTTRRQVLTPAGRTFYQQCQQIDALNKQAWSEAREAQQQAMGQLTISAPHALIDHIVAPAIGALVAEHPRITPFIQAQEERVDLIEQKIDLAIRVGTLKDSEYRQQKIGSFSDQLCVSQQYLTARGLCAEQLIAEPSQLSQCDYIANSWQGRHISHTLTHDNGEIIQLTLNANRFANSINAVLAMITQGAGMGLIPCFMLNPHQQDLINLSHAFKLAPNPVYALHAFQRNPPLAVKFSIAAIKQKMQALDL